MHVFVQPQSSFFLFLFTPFILLYPCACPGNENGWVWLSSLHSVVLVFLRGLEKEGLRLPGTVLDIHGWISSRSLEMAILPLLCMLSPRVLILVGYVAKVTGTHE